jgi:NADPH:quinone reductase-like Zn-dependent oxidoreductase
MIAELFSMAADGMFRTPVDRRFRLEQFADALELAGKGGRKGKVLFEF